MSQFLVFIQFIQLLVFVDEAKWCLISSYIYHCTCLKYLSPFVLSETTKYIFTCHNFVGKTVQIYCL